MMRVIGLWTAMLLITSCDFFHKRRCEWYIAPDKQGQVAPEDGWVPVCVRNYELGRQKCFMAMKESMAHKMDGKPFRFVDLKVDEDSMPRKILEVETCGK